MLRNFSPEATQKARRLRAEMTKPERLLWSALRARRYCLNVRRQHPIGPYVLDFYIDDAMINIEVDGKAHQWRELRDIARDSYLNKLGVVTIRISAGAVLRDPHEVAHSIAMSLRERKSNNSG